jgi:hypothetical protein
MTAPARMPVKPPGALVEVNHAQVGWVIPAACEVSSVMSPQTASEPMITYSQSTIQPWNLTVARTPRTAIAATIAQTRTATTKVRGLLDSWLGATRLRTVDPSSVMLPMFDVRAVISTMMPTAKPMTGESPWDTQRTGPAAEASQRFSRW